MTPAPTLSRLKPAAPAPRLFRRRGLLAGLGLGIATVFSGCGGGTPVKPESASAGPVAVAPAPVPVPPPKPVIGLVLGGGAVRGFAHIGVIKVLQSKGLKPDLVVGTSAGSVAGALYASGMDGFTLQQTAFDLDKATLTDWNLFGNGLLKGEALQAYDNKAVNNRPIEKLPIRFACVATQVSTGQPTLFQGGNTGMAVRASSSVPGVFAPVEIKGQEYVDGGLRSPVPIAEAKRLGANFIIAVDVATPPAGGRTESKMDSLMRTFDIMGMGLRQSVYPLADVLIVPDLSRVTSTDFEGKNLAILAGERAAEKAWPEIRAKLRARGFDPAN